MLGLIRSIQARLSTMQAKCSTLRTKKYHYSISPPLVQSLSDYLHLQVVLSTVQQASIYQSTLMSTGQVHHHNCIHIAQRTNYSTITHHAKGLSDSPGSLSEPTQLGSQTQILEAAGAGPSLCIDLAARQPSQASWGASSQRHATACHHSHSI